MTEIVKIEELNTFLPLASLEALPVEEQKMRLQYWKEHFSIKEILEGLGTYKNKLYDLYKKHEITTQGHMQAKRKGKEKTTPKEDTPNTLEYTHSTEPAQTQTLPSTIPMQDVPVISETKPTTIPSAPIEPSIPESFHIHYTGRKPKQKVIHQLQALATLLEESHEQYQFSIQIETTCLK
ncbi:hypothetical protein [Bacillus thuringiensis]|uniref:hypothetical protein n=1 Tax=Bacillus thuringiensis TaxID=1428 RepID=UPI000B44C7F8|nr:hypothetical protein [Bacillus thuringiensis]MEC2866350.1 hypothetical protein [Bacillus cereus]OTZ80959.1 hypothetical protein BK768_03220 [Bacillus thuringiensis serovar tohokuensis]OUB85913.1 hypothetical protein BK773_22465 [Bacillus thuringiensis serovar indiana]